MHKRRGGTWGCYFVLALATSPTQVAAAEYYVEPSVDASYEFDNNRSLSDPTESASTWKFSPSVNFGRRTPSSSLLGIGRVDVNRSNRDDVDSTDLFFGLLPTYRTERNIWSLDTTYQRDTTLRTNILAPEFGRESDASLFGTTPPGTATTPPGTTATTPPAIAPTQSGIPGSVPSDFVNTKLADTDLGLRGEKVQRNSFVISPRWRRELAPRVGFGLGYRYINTFYSDAEGSDLVDSRSHSANADLSYRWSEVDDVSVITSFQNFQNDENAEFDTYGVEFGWSHRFSETFDAVATGGPEYTDEANGDGSGLSYSFGLGVNKSFERSDLGVFFRRGVAPSENGNALESNQIDIGWSGDISPRLSFALLARAFRNEDTGDSASGTADRSYAQVEPTVSYALTENIFLSLGYRFRWQDDPDASAHAVALSVGYRIGRFGFSR